MKIKHLVTAILLAGAAFAQVGPYGPRGAFGPKFGRHPGETVTGAPYSADVSDTVVQTLAGGNTIQRTMTGHVARDSQGRTYSQETISGGMLGQGGPKTITFISDPVAGYFYHLNPTTKTAIRRAIKQPNQTGAEPQAGLTRQRPASPDVVTTDLGTQVVNGVNAQGKQTNRTIPAGAIGNTQAIVSTSETWYSPELQVVVAAKRSDPRTGQSTYALTNIQRMEPAASLFQVPSDYTIQDAPAGGRRGAFGR